MSTDAPTPHATPAVYRAALDVLDDASIPYLVGGAFGLYAYTGIYRDTKDFDVFLRKDDVPPALRALDQAGYRTEVTFPHWLAKAFQGEYFLDLIHGSGNGACPVDDEWFDHAVQTPLLGKLCRLAPPEEMLWQKVYVMSRERFDGADVIHLIHHCGPRLDWERLLRRLGADWELLLAHLILYRFAFPADRERVPEWLFADLESRRRTLHRQPVGDVRLCRGPLLSVYDYVTDLQRHVGEDARLQPWGRLTPAELAIWQLAFETDPRPSPAGDHPASAPSAGPLR